MLTFVKDKDIALSSADAIVNASNGIGYMGGERGIIIRGNGVAESIHYISIGRVEELSKAISSKHSEHQSAQKNKNHNNNLS